MFVSHVSAIAFAGMRAAWWPCVHRIGAPGMFITVMAMRSSYALGNKWCRLSDLCSIIKSAVVVSTYNW